MAKKAKTPKVQTVLIFSAKADKDYDQRPRLELNLYPCRVEGTRSVKNFSDFDGFSGSLYLADLSIRTWACEASYGEHKGKRAQPYSWSPEYRGLSIDCAETALSIARTLTAIEKSVRAADEKYGYAETFGAKVARVAAAIGAESILVATQTGRGWSHDEAEYKWMAIPEGIVHMDRTIDSWIKAGSEPYAYLYTSAPESYDGMGTRTIERNLETMANGETIRRVEVHTEHLDWQDARYRSGLHSVFTAERWAERVSDRETSAA